jgi:hypothetical protein
MTSQGDGSVIIFNDQGKFGDGPSPISRFKPKDISGMLDLTPGRVSQICAKALHDLFGEENGGAAELAEKLRQIG